MDDKLAQLAKCRSDFEYFGRTCLRIRDKDGVLTPHKINNAQRVVHEAVEKQKAEKGWVRALILEGRQQGCSTYVAARYYHRTSLRKGVNTYILSHEQSSSDGLFDMVDRFQRHSPLAPHIGVSNIKELVFDKLDSSYAVATAGQKAGGRGRTMSLFHGSEVSRWPNARDHFSSSVQAVPLAKDSEIILETTSAGPSGEFYTRYLDAEAGRGDYIAIFLPWHLSSEYSRTPEPGFELTQDAEAGQMNEVEYAEAFGLSLGQMAWRRNKIHELGSVESFMREYPTVAAEAWTDDSGVDSFISPLAVMKARKPTEPLPAAGPLIIGVDPASGGGDRFAVCARRGPRILWTQKRNKIDTLEGTEWCRNLIDEHKPARMNIDAGNIGVAIITNLNSLGPKYQGVVRSINFGGTSQAKLAKPKVPGPWNRRAEMWMRLRDWLMASEGAQIPDDDEFQTDLVSPRRKPRLDNNLLLESKADMKTRGIRSTDLGDAAALTFASNEYFEGYQEATEQVSYGTLDAPRHNAVTQPYPSDGGGGPLSWMS